MHIKLRLLCLAILLLTSAAAMGTAGSEWPGN